MFSGSKDDNINKIPGPCPLKNSKNTSDNNCLYSTDSEFYYVDGKLKEIDDFYREVRNAERLNENIKNSKNNKNNILANPVVIDPVYEIIPEVSDGDELYCLPQDSRPDMANNINKTENKKIKLKSQEKIKSICRSISSPLKMNEFLQSNNKVKRSTSSYRQDDCSMQQSLQQGSVTADVSSWLRQDSAGARLQHPINNKPQSGNNSSLRLFPDRSSPGSSLTLVNHKPSSDIVYTNINNLERTMKDQQEKLLCQLKQPQFVAPPPPQHPPPVAPPPSSSPLVNHEESTSFMSPSGTDTGTNADQHWEWRIKVCKYFYVIPSRDG